MTSDDRFTRILLAASGAAWDAARQPSQAPHNPFSQKVNYHGPQRFSS
ncbi:unnamed protein product, partial [marine sediment metagenome]